jgi:hypothetical protein
MSIAELFQEGTFEPSVTIAMGKAFDLACKSLRGDGAHIDLIKEIIAKRIITCARRGVADPIMLCDAALASLGVSRDCSESVSRS